MASLLLMRGIKIKMHLLSLLGDATSMATAISPLSLIPLHIFWQTTAANNQLLWPSQQKAYNIKCKQL